MRSQFSERFNHDDDAPGYDADVRNETDPIRTGYGALLDWVSRQVPATPQAAVLDLGAGTGNLGLRLAPVGRLVCVDVSREMLRLARGKLAARPEVEFREADLLECLEGVDGKLDAIVSTYAIHHLTEAEKDVLFERIAVALAPEGVAVFGDLMFEHAAARRAYLAACRASGRASLAEDIEDEFFWDLESAVAKLRALGFAVETKRFSDLSWGIRAARG